MTVKTITIGTDYTTVPGGRFTKYGLFSGEDFRDNHLIPALTDYDHVVVNLDGAKSYMSSFLEEAFGGLIRVRGYSYADLKAKLEVRSTSARYSIYLKMIEQNLLDAAAEVAGNKPVRVA